MNLADSAKICLKCAAVRLSKICHWACIVLISITDQFPRAPSVAGEEVVRALTYYSSRPGKAPVQNSNLSTAVLTGSRDEKTCATSEILNLGR